MRDRDRERDGVHVYHGAHAKLTGQLLRPVCTLPLGFLGSTSGHHALTSRTFIQDIF